MVSTNQPTDQKEFTMPNTDASQVVQNGVPVEKQPSTWSVEAGSDSIYDMSS